MMRILNSPMLENIQVMYLKSKNSEVKVSLSMGKAGDILSTK